MLIFLNPAFILTTAFMAFVMQSMWNFWFDVPLLTDGTSTENVNSNILQSHPRCGLTSGGREECWWGCERKKGIDDRIYFTVIFIEPKLITFRDAIKKIFQTFFGYILL